MQNKHFISILATSTLIFSNSAFAHGSEPAQARLEIRDQALKEKLDNLPPQARQRAIERLKELNLPIADHPVIDIDADGEILYVDPKPNTIDETLDETSTTTFDSEAFETIDAVQAFTLHSNPNASRKIIVDFDGHTISNTVWNSTHSTLQAAPYDTDGNRSSFSQAELTAIAHIWHRVAEDFAGYDVDVTTEEPSQLNANTGRILITRNSDSSGKTMPYAGAGGVAYVGVWGRSNYHTYYSPAFVYYNNLGNNLHYIAEASSHEIGHNLGLGHDGKTDGTSYYGGHGSGNTKWGPIMGVGYYAQVTQWSKGDYAQANNTQDDIAIITNKLSLRPDDHGNNQANASPIEITDDGSISATTPEDDPYNTQTKNKGVIEKAGDADFFMLELGDGDLSLTVTPAWASFYTSGKRGSNLDINAKLFNVSGLLIAENDNPTDTHATLNATLTAGTYYLAISNESTGDPATGYDGYGSLGHYYIEGAAVPGDGTGNNNTPPTANGDSFTLSEDNNATLNVLANDNDPEDTPLKIFNFTQPNNGNLILINQDQFTFTPDANFNGVDSFTYTIMDAGGATATAAVQLTVTAINDTPTAKNDGASTEMDTAVTINVLSNDSDPDGEALSASLMTSPAHGVVLFNNNLAVYTPSNGFIGTDSFSYQATDAAGSAATATVSITVTEKQVPPAVPAGFTATDNGKGMALLSWLDTANETSFDIQREVFKQKGKTGWGSSTLMTVSEDIVSRLDDVSNGTYRYRIRSNNALGSSAWSAWQTVEINSNQSKSGGGKGKNR